MLVAANAGMTVLTLVDLRQHGISGSDEDSVPRDVWDNATREGSASMLIFAIVSLASSALLPVFIESSQLPLKGRRESNPLHWIPPISLRDVWAGSQVLFGLCMLAPALFANVAVIKTFVGFLGISWACTIWIPFALITTSISARNARSFVDTVDDPSGLEPATVLALHNFALSAPQAVTACLSSLIFWLTGGQDSGIPLVLGIGGLAGLGAAWAARSLSATPSSENDALEEGIALVSTPQDEIFEDDNDENDDDNDGKEKDS